MKFTLLITGAPYNSEAPYTALHFAKAALKGGHSIYRLFFYQDGVHCGNSLVTPPQDELNLPKEWSQFIQQNKLDCVVCIGAALRRGVIDEQEQNRYELPAANLHKNWPLSGLGQLIEATQHSDQVITFGA
ncbi:sulfurtransferase complex subunit TusD [Spartinivicinus poritis]|uniref:Sulfurtransferase complex subunit TusD n=1 Tax=Spartinivicinus poritis TaxID=2994640 RepID=A0ABT5U5F4_9GAMM|nr:sulfurtransferase complex subunit TusD [Spartinivicinus sp. A2-2]MDE1461591.1 sulfurtransferase complex subunit TusD [Spartinivicinus sp. A2-2]